MREVECSVTPFNKTAPSRGVTKHEDCKMRKFCGNGPGPTGAICMEECALSKELKITRSQKYFENEKGPCGHAEDLPGGGKGYSCVEAWEDGNADPKVPTKGSWKTASKTGYLYWEAQ